MSIPDRQLNADEPEHLTIASRAPFVEVVFAFAEITNRLVLTDESSVLRIRDFLAPECFREDSRAQQSLSTSETPPRS